MNKHVQKYIRKRLLMLLFLWVSFASAPLVMYIRFSSYSYAIYMLLLSYLLAFSITIVLTALDNLLFKFTRTLIASFIFFINVIYVFGQIRHGLTIPIDAIAFIAQTNTQEALEYLSEGKMPLLLIIFIIALFFIYSFIKNYIWNLKEFKIRPVITVFPVIMFILSAVAITHNPDTIRTYLGINNINTLLENSVDLREHLTHPIIIEENNDHPNTIVLIIGESFSKYHSSLYGYEKETNPCLQTLYKNGDLIVFDSIDSPCTSTTPSFKYILNTNTRDNQQKWYETTTIQEAFSVAGYHTCWISNQQEHGVWNNISSGQSLICDEKHFNGAEGETYDFCVVNTYNNLELDNQKNFIFFHLYGQHPQFDKRYPKEFKKFAQSDYVDKPEHQRETLAAYDNATLYNDYVVSSIMKCFEDKDALVIYFSDHGLDLYYVDDDYCAHGRPAIEKSDKMGRDIPFFVYMSEKYKQKHPSAAKLIEQEKGQYFCTETLIYKLLKYTGYKIK